MIMLFAHPAVSGQTFFFFSCHEIDGVKYLIADYSLSCDGAEWRRLLPFAICMVVFFVIGVPLLLLILLVKYRTAIKKIGRSVDEALAEAEVLKEMGNAIDIDKARALYRKIDTDNSGTIDFAEFAKFQLESEDDGVLTRHANIVKMILRSNDPEVMKSLAFKALGLMDVGARSRSRSIRRRATSTVVSNALAASHDAEQDAEDDATVFHYGAAGSEVRAGGESEGHRAAKGPRSQAKEELVEVGGVAAKGLREFSRGISRMSSRRQVDGAKQGIMGGEGQEVIVRNPSFRRKKMHRSPGSAGKDLQGIGGTGGHGGGVEVVDADGKGGGGGTGTGTGDGSGDGDEDLAYLHNWYNNSRREVGGVGGVESKGKTASEKVADLTETKGAAEGAQGIRQKENRRRRAATLVSAHISHEASSRILAEDTQGSILAKERAATEGDGVEMMLGVLWLNYKPECFFFDM